MAKKRLYNLTEAQTTEDYSIVVDNKGYTEAKVVKKTDLLYNDTIEGAAASRQDIVVTPFAFSKSAATTSNVGTLKTSDDTTAIAFTDEAKALTPSNIPAIVNEVNKITHSYSSGDFDSAASNYNTLTLDYFDEAEIGDRVWHNGSFKLTNTSQVTDFDVYLNVINDNTPINGVTFIARWRNDNGGNPVYQPIIGYARTYIGKLFLRFSNGTSNFPAKTTSPDVWDFEFTYTFYK